MPSIRKTLPIILALLTMCAGSARAELAAVSGKAAAGNPNALTEVLAGGNPADVAVSLAHGFPVWYRDTNNVKLELCLDKPNAGITPCVTAEPFTGAPISFPNNFGPEAFWWMATAFTTYDSRLNGALVSGGDLLLVLALEAAFANDIVDDTQQVAFGRIRIRMNVPVPGTYRVTHPYGTTDYVVAAAGAGREINQTQDLGILTPQNFLTVLPIGPDPATIVPLPGFPAIDSGIISSAATNIGPFLRPTATPYNPATHLGGPLVVGTNRYLGEPGLEITPITQPIVAGPPNATPQPPVFTVELINPPANFFLNAVDNTQIITLNQFQVMGKMFNDAPNVAPVAVADIAATAKNTPVTIDVAANDTDVVAMDPADPFNPANPLNTNVHGINPQAVGIFVSPADIRRTVSFTTAAGGTVSRFTNLATGRATFTYTPASGFTGVDSFQYVVQDTGGLVSAPATVTVTVEDLGLTRADYRSRFGKWRIEGTSSDITANSVTIHGGPRAFLSGSTAARGRLGLKVTPSAISYRISLDTPPATAPTRIDIRLDAADGPAIFTLYDSTFDGPIGSVRSGTLTSANLQPRFANGVGTFAEAIARIENGTTFVTVRTSATPGGAGELSGRLTRPVVGTATVGANGKWTFLGKSVVSPGPFGSVSATSSNGISTGGVGLNLR